MSRKKIVLIVVAALFVLIQFIPQNPPLVTADNPDDIAAGNIPEDVKTILRKACYDCHSNESVFPWYSNVAPVKWLVYADINKGRKELNFSEWNKMSLLDKSSALDDIASEVEEGEMPMKIYTLMHKEARLDSAERQSLINWANKEMETLFE